MGQAIVYCARCQKRILESDLDKGSAYQVEHQTYCGPCACLVAAELPDSQRKNLLDKMSQSVSKRQSSSTDRPPTEGATPSRRPGKSTERIPVIGGGYSTPASGTESGARRSTVFWGIGLALGALVLLLILFNHKSNSDSASTANPPSARDRGIARDPSARESPEEGRRWASAQKSLEKARDFVREHPSDWDGQLTLWEEAMAASAETPYAPEAKRERTSVLARREETIGRLKATLEVGLRALSEKEEFESALEMCGAAEKEMGGSSWKLEVARMREEILAKARKTLAPLREQALAARRKGSEADVRAILDRVGKWGLPEFRADLEKVLSETRLDAPPLVSLVPNPGPPKSLSKEAEAYGASWQKALVLASRREYSAAMRELEGALKQLQDSSLRQESAIDLEVIRPVGSILSESREVLSKWPKSQKLSLDYLDPKGHPVRVEAPPLRIEPFRIVFKQDDGPLAVELGEITPGSWAELWGTRPGKRTETDDRAKIVFCLLEGDLEGAKKLQGTLPSSIPEKYWSYGSQVLESRRLEAGSPEAQARGLFYAAEEGMLDYAQTGKALESYKSLLSQYAGTGFVIRNRASIASRAEGGKEYPFWPELLRGAGTFKLGKAGKLEMGWISQEDSVAEKLPENYVELSFYALPGLEYRCWVYAGACCLETYSFSIQATELGAPNPKNPKEMLSLEPGGRSVAPVKVNASLRRTHAMHGGPKAPTHWEWIPIPLPKYSAPGLKTVRFLTDQKGFSVAYALVSATRIPTPKESEVKELESLRAEHPHVGTLSPGASAAPGLIGHWRFDEGMGTVARDSSGKGHAATVSGAVWTEGKWGGALRFDGKSSFVELPNSPVLDKLQEGSYTLCAWFKPEGTPSGQEGTSDLHYALIMKTGRNEGIQYMQNSHFIFFHFSANGTAYAAETSQKTFPPGTFYHVAGLINRTAGKVEIYVNGALEGSSSWTPDTPGFDYGTMTWKVGTAVTSGSENRLSAKGVIDDVRLYNRALEAAEIEALYKSSP